MKTALFNILMFFQTIVFAEQCQGITELVKQIGVSFAGIEVRTPRSAIPDRSQWIEHDVLFIKLPKKLEVMDAFHHTIWVNKSLNLAWIVQFGGIRGVTEFYGPINIEKEKFENCISTPPDTIQQNVRNN